MNFILVFQFAQINNIKFLLKIQNFLSIYFFIKKNKVFNLKYKIKFAHKLNGEFILTDFLNYLKYSLKYQNSLNVLFSI